MRERQTDGNTHQTELDQTDFPDRPDRERTTTAGAATELARADH